METDSLASFQDLLDRWAEAIVANDAPLIGSFAEPDWVMVTPEGGPGKRADFLAAVESGQLSHSEMAFEVLEARVYGDVAVVLAHGTNRGSWRGVPFTADEWVTETFIHRSAGWLCAFSALTPNYAAASAADVDA
ncbi:nuclear transport factor 2 family protein [Paeniglutamicibacter terrestris]|uniref:Nuclear transport factor 2 family protein n=1 Tax=Paeniglutamicibacter terrestris TaxID=2723403 RepID=A0ABX1G3E7_9MICC|nr:nuclear transport factor 2 family protein [Paeniglutamicibacter terrestris]NKG20763.1 nuclear transport factor 2 family protein [Paeniglutamicibacter terrestris]